MGDIRPTDHLANERTFLAYIRTSLSVMAFGFVIARFGLFLRLLPNATRVGMPHEGASEMLGLAFAIFGSALGLFGTWRYWAEARMLAKGRYVSSSTGPLVVGIATVLLGLIVVASLFRLI